MVLESAVRVTMALFQLGQRPAGRRASWKKAMVTLTADSKTIEFFEGMV